MATQDPVATVAAGPDLCQNRLHDKNVVGRGRRGWCIGCRRAAQARYHATPKGRATKLRYNHSPKGQATNDRYVVSHPFQVVLAKVNYEARRRNAA